MFSQTNKSSEEKIPSLADQPGLYYSMDPSEDSDLYARKKVIPVNFGSFFDVS